jgi:hypothetical protein
MDETADVPEATDPPLTQEDVMIELGWLELWHASRESVDPDEEN